MTSLKIRILELCYVNRLTIVVLSSNKAFISVPAAAGFLSRITQETMPHFDRAIIVAGLLAVFTGLASAQGNPLICTANVTVTPALRGEGYTELTAISPSRASAPRRRLALRFRRTPLRSFTTPT